MSPGDGSLTFHPRKHGYYQDSHWREDMRCRYVLQIEIPIGFPEYYAFGAVGGQM
jgi:hypothetical protein